MSDTSPIPTDPPMIHAAIAAIIRDLPAIGKDSRMDAGPARFNYRGIDDIMPSVKTLFGRYGVHLAPSYRVLAHETGLGRNGNQTWVQVEGTITWFASDGSSFDTVTIGQASDTSDKAFNKAETAAMKYAIVQTLAITDGDDPDAAPHPDVQDAAQPPQAPAEPPEPPEGCITVAEAKGEFLEACGGDKACAKTAWEAAGLEIVQGHFVNVAQVLQAIADNAPTGEAPAVTDDRAAEDERAMQAEGFDAPEATP